MRENQASKNISSLGHSINDSEKSKRMRPGKLTHYSDSVNSLFNLV